MVPVGAGDDLRDGSAIFTPASGGVASVSSAAARQNGFGESSEINIVCHTQDALISAPR